MYNQSPLETLAAFAITYIAGALSIVAVSAYGKWMKHQCSQAREFQAQ